jgi:hypothetical protein
MQTLTQIYHKFKAGIVRHNSGIDDLDSSSRQHVKHLKARQQILIKRASFEIVESEKRALQMLAAEIAERCESLEKEAQSARSSGTDGSAET